jgi:hypothetical protein
VGVGVVVVAAEATADGLALTDGVGDGLAASACAGTIANSSAATVAGTAARLTRAAS